MESRSGIGTVPGSDPVIDGWIYTLVERAVDLEYDQVVNKGDSFRSRQSSLNSSVECLSQVLKLLFWPIFHFHFLWISLSRSLLRGPAKQVWGPRYEKQPIHFWIAKFNVKSFSNRWKLVNLLWAAVYSGRSESENRKAFPLVKYISCEKS